jgi:hypothetical protein
MHNTWAQRTYLLSQVTLTYTLFSEEDNFPGIHMLSRWHSPPLLCSEGGESSKRLETYWALESSRCYDPVANDATVGLIS